MPEEKTPSTRFSPVIVAPTFNNAGTLADVLRRARQSALPMIVVNDGSTDQTGAILREMSTGQLTLVTHAGNRGKAAALLSGFQAARDAGFTHAITIDTDGQHDPEQIGQFIEAARKFPRAIILGSRDHRTAGYPIGSRLGRGLSNGMIWLESGLKVCDSQCGFRVYPLELAVSVHCAASRYGFETEILTRAAWAGWRVEQIEINCRYFPRESRVSHFRPIFDSLHSVGMHVRLVNRGIITWPMRFIHWISPLRAWRDMRHDEKARDQFAAGLALGAFIACLPLYGVQGIISLFAAKRLNLHPISVFAGTQISNPPISLALIFASLDIGHVMLNGQLLGVEDWNGFINAFRAATFPVAALRRFLVEWTLGGLVLGMVLAMAMYIIATAIMRISKRAGRKAEPVQITPKNGEMLTPAKM